MKTVMVLSTGGTIASVPGHAGRNIAGALTGESLLDQIQLQDHINLQVESVFQKSSNSINSTNLMQLRAKCQSLINSGKIAGIVITHGTDTLEETAYFLECTLDLQNTVVVVTGSQRVPHAAGTDAYVNLQHAIQVAANPAAVGLGVLVVFNETIFAAALVVKTSTFQLNGFSAPGFGCLGYIDNNNLLLYQQPFKQPRLKPQTDDLPQVELLTVTGGSNTAILQALIQAKVAAIVIAGLGRGQVPPDWVAVIKQAIENNIRIVVCSSVLTGSVAPCYEYPGALYELEHLGAVAVSGLSGRKARIRTMLVLAAFGQDCSNQTITEQFAFGRPD